MAKNEFWPNCEYDYPTYFTANLTYTTAIMLPFNKPRTKANLRIGPHNKEVLDVIICGMLATQLRSLRSLSCNAWRFLRRQNTRKIIKQY